MLADFFDTLPAITVIFQWGFEPTPDMFTPLTSEEMEALGATGERTDVKWFAVILDGPLTTRGERIIVTERERMRLLQAAAFIEKVCRENGREFASYEDKLTYVAKCIPPIILEGTPYE
ncbi:hypothetical protein KKF84_01220 [Myxococcota bacterium]|nr:hypothetical protein [Myxococcota bacterium]MBU1533904.1 hypothetical protein [Myxococcota bacterium]